MNNPKLDDWFRKAKSARGATFYQLLEISPEEMDGNTIRSSISSKVQYLKALIAKGIEVSPAQRLLQRIEEAKSCLSNANHRAVYNRTLEQAPSAAKPSSALQIDIRKRSASKNAPTPDAHFLKNHPSGNKPKKPSEIRTRQRRKKKSVVPLIVGIAACLGFLAVVGTVLVLAQPDETPQPVASIEPPLVTEVSGRRKRVQPKARAKAEPNQDRIANDNRNLPAEPSPAINLTNTPTHRLPPLQTSRTNPVEDILLSNSPAKASALAPEVTKRPFKRLIDIFDLPALEDIAEHKVDDVIIKKNYLMEITLHQAEVVSSKIPHFQIRRSTEDKQRWVISKHRRKNSTGEDIATFWKTETELYFQWFPEAQSSLDTNYLRNAIVRLETPDGQKGWIHLREPEIIPGFRVAKNGSVVDIETELKWMLPGKHVTIELQQYDGAEVPSRFDPSRISENPGVIFFSNDPKDNFVWVEVYGKEGRKWKFSAAVKGANDGQVYDLTREQLAEFMQRIQTRRDELLTRLEAGTPPYRTQQQFNEAVNELETKETQLESVGKILSSLDRFYENDIPIAIYTKIDGRKVLLAKTPNVIGFQ